MLSHRRRSATKPHLVKFEGRWIVLPMFYRTEGYMDKFIKAQEWARSQNRLQQSILEMFRNA